MIKIDALSKSYGSKKILSNLNLIIKKGSITGVVGPNACGKTTLLKCLLGLVIPTSGEIWIDNQKLDPQGQFRRKIGYMPQTPIFPRNLNLEELLNMLENLRAEPAPSRKWLVEYFGLDKVRHQPFEQLSGGTQQKVAAVLTFMFDAPIIILDEPTVGLDPATAVLFKDLVLKRAQDGATIILVSHIMTEVEQMADEMAVINEGQIVFSGTTKSLLEKMNASQLERAVIRLFQDKVEGE